MCNHQPVLNDFQTPKKKILFSLGNSLRLQQCFAPAGPHARNANSLAQKPADFVSAQCNTIRRGNRDKADSHIFKGNGPLLLLPVSFSLFSVPKTTASHMIAAVCRPNSTRVTHQQH
eukprot:s456_g10.t1